MSVRAWRRSARYGAPFGQIMRQHARTFSLAARFLDPNRRAATEVLYAFFRTVDDLVDERPADADLREIHVELERWHRLVSDPEAAQVSCSPLARALGRVMTEHAIPPAYLHALLDGLTDDLDNRPILTFPDLERYAFRVAGTVGLAMCHVLGATTPSALTAASAVGIGMQLTNIVRDVDADLRQGRIYLPAEEIARFGGAEEALQRRRMSPALGDLLQLHVERADRYYLAGSAGVPELPARVRYPILVAIDLYREILRAVERRALNVFDGRVVVGRPRKALLAGRVALRQLTGYAQPTRTPLDVLGPAALSELQRVGVQPGARRATPDNQPALASA
ncbi:MAG: phytoene/squalene synthase family protein [Chloroflexi bacterium]|nr:phytoene/squalene synthase family protein [Chloroflexota bacterium]